MPDQTSQAKKGLSVKKILSPHTLLTSVAFAIAILFPYERVTAAVDASVYTHYDNAVQTRFTTTIDYVNDYRLHNGQSALSFNNELQEVAQKRAEEISRTKLFDHFDLEGRTFYKYFGDNAPQVACENLSSSLSDNPSTPFRGWRKSPPHKECMLDSRMNKVGFAQMPLDTKHSQHRFITVMIAGS